jgi:hypothetical protein
MAAGGARAATPQSASYWRPSAGYAYVFRATDPGIRGGPTGPPPGAGIPRTRQGAIGAPISAEDGEPTDKQRQIVERGMWCSVSPFPRNSWGWKSTGWVSICVTPTSTTFVSSGPRRTTSLERCFARYRFMSTAMRSHVRPQPSNC